MTVNKCTKKKAKGIMVRTNIWIGLVFSAFLAAEAQPPEMFRYQGRLVDGTNLVNDILPMSFKLYNAQVGGVLLYEDFNNSVPVVDGFYATYIGDDTDFGSLTDALTNAAVYVEVTINNEILSPREPLVSVPYVLNQEITGYDKFISVNSNGLEFSSLIDSEWSGWSDSFYSLGNQRNKMPVPTRFKGPLMSDTGIFINHTENPLGNANVGRWGCSVFDATGAETNNRLSFFLGGLWGQMTNTACIFYFDDGDYGARPQIYRKLQLGSDWYDQGMIIDPGPDPTYLHDSLVMGKGGSMIRRWTNVYWLLLSGADRVNKWGEDHSGATLRLCGGDNDQSGSAVLSYGNYFTNNNTASVIFNHMSNSTATERASLDHAGLFTASGGFRSGTKSGLTTNIVVDGKTLIFTGGILTGVSQ